MRRLERFITLDEDCKRYTTPCVSCSNSLDFIAVLYGLIRFLQSTMYSPVITSRRPRATILLEASISMTCVEFRVTVKLNSLHNLDTDTILSFNPLLADLLWTIIA